MTHVKWQHVAQSKQPIVLQRGDMSQTSSETDQTRCNGNNSYFDKLKSSKSSHLTLTLPISGTTDDRSGAARKLSSSAGSEGREAEGRQCHHSIWAISIKYWIMCSGMWSADYTCHGEVMSCRADCLLTTQARWDSSQHYTFFSVFTQSI